MLVLALILLFMGFVLSQISTIWLIVVAFRKSAGWGWACLLIPFAMLVFMVQFWEESAKPFLVGLCSVPLLAAAAVMFVLSIPGIQNAESTSPTDIQQPASGFGESPPQVSPFVQSGNPFETGSQLSSSRSPTNFSSASLDNVSRGDLYRPPNPRSPLTLLRYEAGDVVLSTLMGPRFGSEFNDASPAGGILIGLRVSEDSQSSHGIASIRPIYQVGSPCIHGDLYGRTSGNVHELIAKSGYAVGGLLLRTTTAIELIQVIFCKVKTDGRLDVGDQYLSERIGRESGTKRRIFSEGRPIVEVFGSASTSVSGIGLGAVQPSSATPASELARDDRPDTEQQIRDPFETAPNPSKLAADEATPKTPVVPVAEAIRTWSSSGGTFKVDAKLKSVDGSDAILEQRDGKTFRVAIDKLSVADQDYLKSRQKK